MEREAAAVASRAATATTADLGIRAPATRSDSRLDTISVITLSTGRASALQLRNQWKGLLGGAILPHEWILVSLNGPAVAPDPAPFPISLRSWQPGMPVSDPSAVRDAAAEAARGDILVFLDEDCIPHPRFLECMRRAVRSGRHLWKGQVRYLSPRFPSRHWYPNDLETHARCRSTEPGLALQELHLCDRCDHGWAPSCAIDRESYRRSGGLSNLARHIATSRTDLAQAARAHGMGFGLAGARVYRQTDACEALRLGCFD